MRKRKKLVAALAALLALLIIVPILAIILSGGASAASEAELDVLRRQQEILQQRQAELQDELNRTQWQITSLQDKKMSLDRQMELTTLEINNLKSQIIAYNKMIEQESANYKKAVADEEQQREIFKKRVRIMEELGTVSYISVIFSANSFSDLLDRLDFISEIMESDEQVVKKYQELQDETERARGALEQSRAELETAQRSQEDKIADYKIQIAESDALLVQLGNVTQTQLEAYRENEAVEQLIAEQILAITQELEHGRTEDEERQTGAVSTGRYLWPSDCKYVTEKFGYRINPVSGLWGHHNAIDISGSIYGTPVYASDGGSVVTATSSETYGKYVMLYHGEGRYTLYAHLSELGVYVGQTVKQGDTIGLAGSTGWSTGPHIHFEIIENGEYIDPLQFFTDYIPWWD